MGVVGRSLSGVARWPRRTLPAEDLYLSHSVFPFETTIFLEIFPLERERFLIFPLHALQRCPGRSALPREHWPYRRSGAGTKLDGELRQAPAPVGLTLTHAALTG